MTGYEKVYVAMLLKVARDGRMRPAAVEWTDGTLYEIDRVAGVHDAPPEHTGGLLTRKYKVIIRGREKTLYLERQTNRWFVEKLCI